MIISLFIYVLLFQFHFVSWWRTCLYVERLPLAHECTELTAAPHRSPYDKGYIFLRALLLRQAKIIIILISFVTFDPLNVWPRSVITDIPYVDFPFYISVPVSCTHN